MVLFFRLKCKMREAVDYFKYNKDNDVFVCTVKKDRLPPGQDDVDPDQPDQVCGIQIKGSSNNKDNASGGNRL